MGGECLEESHGSSPEGHLNDQWDCGDSAFQHHKDVEEVWMVVWSCLELQGHHRRTNW